MAPLFSIVIPVYKTEQYLAKCLQSIISQSYADFEVVVVDDGSDGNAREIIDSFRDKRIRCVRHEKNRGLLQARVTGVRASCGQYIVAMDADDYFGGKDLFKSLSHTILENENVDIVTYWTTLTDGEKCSSFWANAPKGELHDHQILDALFSWKIFWSSCGKCISRNLFLSAISEVNIPKDLFLIHTEDLVLFLPVATLAKKLISIEYSGYNYVKHTTSSTIGVTNMTKWKKCFTDVKNAWALLDAFAVKKGDPELRDHIKRLQNSTIRWGLKEINAFSGTPWNDRFIFMLNSCCPELVFEYFRNEHLHHMHDLDLSGWVVPKPENKKIKTIALICSMMANGGAERASAVLIGYFHKHGYRVVLFNNSAPCDGEYAFPAVPRYVLPCDNLADRWKVLREKCLLHSVDCAIVVDHWSPMAFFDVTGLKHFGCKVIMQEHSAYFYPLINSVHHRIYYLRKPFYVLADAITCLSDMNEKWWHAAGYPQAVYVPNLLSFQADKDVQPAELNSNQILYIGRIVASKGCYDAVDMMKQLAESRPDIELCMLGRFESKEEEIKFKAYVEQQGVTAQIKIAGHVSDVASYLKKSAALIMTSRVEGAPMVLFEAKAYGVPTVLFDMPYVDCISEEDGAITVPQKDVNGMAAVLSRLLGEDRHELKELGRKALKSLDRFKDDVTMDKWWKLFRQLEEDIPFEPGAADPFLKTTMTQYDSAIDDLTKWFDKKLQMKADELRQKEKELRKQKSVIRRQKNEIRELQDSISFQAGRMMTWPLRMVRNSCRCLQENGLVYTLKRVKAKEDNLTKRFLKKSKKK